MARMRALTKSIFNFGHGLDWYLQTTGQRLVSASGAAVPRKLALPPAAGAPQDATDRPAE